MYRPRVRCHVAGNSVLPHIYIHTCIHTYIHTCTYIHIYSYIDTYVRAYIPAYSYIHEYIIHTYILVGGRERCAQGFGGET